MAWNKPGGDKGDKDPWRDRDPDTEVDAFMERLRGGFRGVFGGEGGGGEGSGEPKRPPILIFVIGIVVVWLALDSWTLIDERQRGVVLRFGEMTRVMQPGLNLKFPRPIERVYKVATTEVRNFSDKVQMLTQDENIVDIEFNVQYRVADPMLYLFGSREPDDSLQQAAESAVREIMGANEMDEIVSGDRALLAEQAGARVQEQLAQYRTGLAVTEFQLRDIRPPAEVQEAFDDAIRAREDKQRFENEAQAYERKVVPEARGEAARIRAEAEGYLESKVATAEGEADRFVKLSSEYAKAPVVTRKRLYLETMEEVLAANPKMLIDDDAGRNILYLPIDRSSSLPTLPDSEVLGASEDRPSSRIERTSNERRTRRDSVRPDRDGDQP